MTAVIGSFMHSTTHLFLNQLRCVYLCVLMCVCVSMCTCMFVHMEWNIAERAYTHMSTQVRKFMGGYEMFAQAQRDLTAEQVCTCVCMCEQQ